MSIRTWLPSSMMCLCLRAFLTFPRPPVCSPNQICFALQVCEKRGIRNGDAFAMYEMTPEGAWLDPERCGACIL